ncbi:MAG: Crp/Fnr family transcriptional regulator [Bdellovibrionota bacterium]|jgi:CRP-like cAMP-binding protein|nr:Crp/Fnr family transcriptional regulator [Bdellovibrionota bacterium]
MHKKAEHNCSNCPSLTKGVFCSLGAEELKDVSDHKITNIYKKGQTLFVQGNHPFGLYCISSGNIKVTKIGADGKESIVRIATAGDVLGHRSLFTDQYYMATATALEDTKVCFLDKKFIMKVINDQPTVSMNIIEKLSADMGAAENKLSSLHQKNVRERLAELLLLLKESHGEKLEDGRTKIVIKLTREEMATMIGTANETLIRFISEFKEAGLIEQEGKIIIIKNEEELIDWANLSY